MSKEEFKIMVKCSICGNFTLKNRPVCIGCVSLKDVGKHGIKSSNTKKERAIKHLVNNPQLKAISWPSFSKKSN